jgi:zinc transport system substrate-binding protein
MRQTSARWSIGAALVLAFGGAGPIHAQEIQVVASIKPIHSLVAGVMQGVGEPVLLVKGAASPHSYSMRPSEARAVEESDVVFWVGEGLETFLVKPLQALAAGADVVELSEAQGVHLLRTREGGVWDEHQHEDHGDEQQAEHGHGDEHVHGAFDMHLWLDPHNAEAMVGAIVAALSQADPDHATIYQRNGSRLHGQLEQLDETLSTRLKPVRDRPFVVFHDAYQYFQNRYGLDGVGAISVDPGRRPGAQRLQEIRHRLEELDAACVFAEPQFEPALVDTVIEGTSTRKGVLDPLGANLAAGPEQYFRVMNGLADSVIDCLGTATSG